MTPASLDLSNLSIRDLTRLFEVTQTLEAVLLGQIAIPATSEAATAVIDALIIEPVSDFQCRVMGELSARSAATADDVEIRAAALAKWHLIGGERREAINTLEFGMSRADRINRRQRRRIAALSH